MREVNRLLALLATTLILLIGPAALDSRAADRFVPIDRATGLVDRTKVTVEPGDHLWSISERRMRQVKHGDVSDERVAVYWRTVIDRNVGRIKSGDPDLIFPGETIVLPPSKD
jgi:hypothetical protein